MLAGFAVGSRRHPGAIAWQISRHALLVAGSGLLIGAIVSLSLLPAFNTFLAAVNPLDPAGMSFVACAADGAR